MEKLRNFDGQLASKDLESLEQKKQIELMKVKIDQQKGSDPERALRRQSQSVKNIVAQVHY